MVTSPRYGDRVDYLPSVMPGRPLRKVNSMLFITTERRCSQPLPRRHARASLPQARRKRIPPVSISGSAVGMSLLMELVLTCPKLSTIYL
jgi:hypothetical protein